MHSTRSGRRPSPLSLLPLVVLLAACSGGGGGSPSTSATGPVMSGAPASAAALPASAAPASGAELPSDSAPPPEAASASPTLEPVGISTAGDIPDNAVFLSYKGGTPPFAIQYVEGWQVTPQGTGVVIRDKDSSETVAIVPAQADIPGWIASTDLPALQAQAGFRLVKQNRAKVGSTTYDHVVYHLPAPPDPVTGKRVPSTVDRYYVPGPSGIAVVSLSTPDGVDNVDAFRQMIQSFRWR